MPAHQRPSPRELGRRSEAADHPFKAMRPDEAGSGGRALSSAAWVPQTLPPLVTAGQNGNRMVIMAADPAAIAKGLAPGMAVTHARALEPGLDVRDADPRADRAILDRLVLFAVRRWTPTAMVRARFSLGMATEYSPEHVPSVASHI